MKFKLDARIKFITQRVVRPWYRLPKKSVDAPALEMPKVRLDVVLGSLFCCWGCILAGCVFSVSI